MRAIILAAGIGKRLEAISAGKPKCLLEFEQLSLLRRHIILLRQFGISDILLVCGYREADLHAELDKLEDRSGISTLSNADFREGSVISLWTAHAALQSGDDIILMDADVLYHPEILQRLVNSAHDNCFLLDRDFIPGDEPVKICVREQRMIEFRKQIDAQLQFDFQGESVGFFRFSSSMAAALAARCRHYIDSGDRSAPYEEALRDLLLAQTDSFAYEDVSGLPWIEIDFPEDVSRAENEILRKINSDK